MAEGTDTKHLAMLPEQAQGERRRRDPPKLPQAPIPPDRRAQAAAIDVGVARASQEVVQKRQLRGVQSDRLIVLELASSANWGEQAITQFEAKFGAVVVDERVLNDKEGRITRLIVQFETTAGLNLFRQEALRYGQLKSGPGLLSERQGQTLFDALKQSRALSREDRIGRRLRSEGWPERESFGIDVEAWHPGSAELAREVIGQIRELCVRHGGRLADDLRTPSLIVCRILGSRELGEALLELDLVARLDLPPVIAAEEMKIFEPLEAPVLPEPPEGVAAVCVVDSGVLSSHPLLAGWVLEAEDFGSGEDTPADLQGHGTKVCGLVVHGDFSAGLATGAWRPLVPVYSAKVLRRGVGFDVPEFPEDMCPIAMIDRAIRHFAENGKCRIFNLSLGNMYDVYAGGRQFAWAAALDHLIRELDIVVVIAAGNVALADIPIPADAVTKESFQAAVRDAMLSSSNHRVCDPATAALGLTVGAIARLDELPAPRAGHEHAARASLTGSPAGGPSPFSRVGGGYEGQGKPGIKPDFVAWGGNVRIDSLGGTARWRAEPTLGEITTAVGDRTLTRGWGTSFAAPRVAQAAALALGSLREVLADEPSANVVRALLGVTSTEPICGYEWLKDPGATEHWDKLRLAGHGVIQTERLLASMENDLIIVADEEVIVDGWHIYRLPVPRELLSAKGDKGVTVALAFDPPVRVSRRPYLSRTMSVEIIKNQTSQEIEKACSQAYKKTELALDDKYYAGARPPSTVGERSTLQVRRLKWSRKPKLALDEDGGATLHVFVECHRRFATDADAQPQGYGLAVRLWASDPAVRLREAVKARLNLRQVVRQRVSPSSR